MRDWFGVVGKILFGECDHAFSDWQADGDFWVRSCSRCRMTERVAKRSPYAPINIQ